MTKLAEMNSTQKAEFLAAVDASGGDPRMRKRYTIQPVNLFNPFDVDCAFGFYVRSDTGGLLASIAYNATGFIPIVGGQTYTRYHFPLNPLDSQAISNGQVAYFDNDRTYISGDAGSGTFAFTTPANAAFVRMSIPTQFWWDTCVSQASNPVTTLAPNLGWEPLVDKAHFNLEVLRQTKMRVGNRLFSFADQLVINLIGDSYFQGGDRCVTPLTNYLVSKLGDAGGGFTSFAFKTAGTTPYAVGGNQPSSINGNARPSVYPVRYVGAVASATDANYYQNPVCALGVAILSATGDAIEVDYPASPTISGVDLHWVGTGTGSIRYTFNGGSTWTTLSVGGTAGTTVVTSLSLTGYSGAGTLRIEWVTGSAKLAGVDFKSAASGVRVNKLAATGGALAQWSAQLNDNWSTSFNALGGHLTIIEDGRNSQAAGTTASTRDGQLRGLINRVRGQVTATFGTMAMDVLIYTPPENQAASRTVAIGAYGQADRRRAFIQRCAHINGQRSFGEAGLTSEYMSAGAVPLFNADLVHPDPGKGGTVMAMDLLMAIIPIAA